MRQSSHAPRPARASRLLQIVRRAVADRGLFAGAECVVLGVSGGADSVAMVHSLARVAARRRPRLVVAHLHHGIRGASADRDAAFVKALARGFGLDCVVGRDDVPGRARRAKVSIEMAARAARHAFFRRVVAETGADRVALAHTADDQAETVLLRLCRGAGSAGLSAMAPDVRVEGLRIIRPMLGLVRADIEAYLRDNGIRWRTDPSNRDPRHLRNRIRRRVVPMLARELNPSVQDALCTTADILGAEDAWIGAAARRALVRTTGPGGSLNAASLAWLPVALARRVVGAWLRTAGLQDDAVGFPAVERVLGIARSGKGRAPVGSGFEVRMIGGQLVFGARRPAAVRPVWRAVRLAIPGSTEIPGAGLICRTRRTRGYRRKREPRPGQWPTMAWLDASKCAGGAGLIIRPWKPGDRYRPMGAPGSAKVHDLLVNSRVPRDRRAGLPVVESSGEIVWLPGHRIADAWRVPSHSAPSLRIELHPRDGGTGPVSS